MVSPFLILLSPNLTRTAPEIPSKKMKKMKMKY